MERSRWRISFPVEVRWAPADDLWLSTAHGRDTVYLAFHVNAQTDHATYFEEVERILRMDQTGTAGACPACGAPHSPSAAFCWQCGSRLLEYVQPGPTLPS